MPQYTNVETITLVNINNGKQHIGYWMPIEGYVNGGTFVSLCSNKRSAAHALIPVDAECKSVKKLCSKCQQYNNTTQGAM